MRAQCKDSPIVSFPHQHDWALPQLSSLTAPQTVDDPQTPPRRRWDGDTAVLVCMSRAPRACGGFRALGQGIAAHLLSNPESMSITSNLLMALLVVDHALQPPHRECCDVDLRLTIHEETLNKPLRSRWVPSRRDIAKAKTKDEGTEIKRNDEVDRLGKMATGLPLPEYTPTHPPDIAVNGVPAPTPAKKMDRREETL